MADLITSVYGALDKLDCAINAYGCVMMELDDDPERDDKREESRSCPEQWCRSCG
jgi:hypothetical protein